MKNRLGIFVMYDPDGIADEYIFYLLDSLAKNIKHLVIVCNGDMVKESICRLSEYTNDVIIRENSGYDWGAYRYALAEYLGWDKIREYDELVLVNDSCYGPLYSIEEVFADMDSRGLDFWGITEHQPVVQEDIPYHIQSNFLVVGKKMLSCGELFDYWTEGLPEVTLHEAVDEYKLRFTNYFNSLGYKSGAYIDSAPFQDALNYNYSLWDAYRLIANQRCPFIKRKVFTLPLSAMLRYHSGETARRALDYIDRQLSYDASLIWKNLIRTCDVTELYNSLHLNYVFPANVSYDPQALQGKKIAVVAHLFYDFQLEENLDYIDRIPECIDIIITTPSEENIKIINNHIEAKRHGQHLIIQTENRGRDVAALLVGCKEHLMKYDYLCFVHDKNNNKSSNYSMSLPLGRSYKDLLWENTLKSREYIENVISCFENNPQLGFLSVPTLRGTHRAWQSNYEVWDTVIKRMGIKCHYSESSFPVSLGNSFWCRTTALEALFKYDFDYNDFPPEPMPLDGALSHAIERVFPFVAQHEGYFSGVMMTFEYASLYSVLYQYVTNAILSTHYNIGFNISETLKERGRRLTKFVLEFKKVYIYGAGVYGERCIEQFLGKIYRFLGIIVSDGHKEKNREIIERGYNVFELSEISPEDDEGILVALGKNAANEVIPQLLEKGFKNIEMYSQK